MTVRLLMNLLWRRTRENQKRAFLFEFDAFLASGRRLSHRATDGSHRVRHRTDVAPTLRLNQIFQMLQTIDFCHTNFQLFDIRTQLDIVNQNLKLELAEVLGNFRDELNEESKKISQSVRETFPSEDIFSFDSNRSE